jgi:hypothetical protein
MSDDLGFDPSGPGVQDEHAPRKEERKPASYEPTPEEKKAIKLVEKLFSKAKRHRALYDQQWLEFYRFFRGKQWKEQRPSYRHSEVINFVFQTIQSSAPLQNDSRPRFDFLPEEPSDLELASILSDTAAADWTKNNWSMELYEVILDSNIYGTGFSETCYEPKLSKIMYQSADPFHCYPDPDATDVNKKGDFFIYAEPIEIDKLKRRYPEKKDYLKADMMDLLKGQKNETGLVRFRDPVDSKVTVDGDNASDLIHKSKALLITCYIKAEALSDEFDEVEQPVMGQMPVMDEMGNQIGMQEVQTGTEFVQIAKYPNGRKIVVCNNVILSDGPNPYDDGEFPYERLVNYPLSREFWGISEVEQLMGPQKIFNKVFSFALDVLTLMGNPIWVVSTDSDVDVDNLVNRPGLVVEKTPGSEVRREEGVQLQPYVLQIADKIQSWIEGLSGSQDVSRGVQPTGVTAASAISQLQEAALTRIRQKSRNQDGYLQDVGRHWTSRTFQFRTAPEIFRLTSQDGANKYFRAYVEPYENDSGEKMKRFNVTPYTENGKIDPTQGKTYETRAKFDVKVSTGSNLPFNKAEKEQRLLGLFDRGAIDRQELLKGSDYPNWEAVEQRMAQKEAAAAQAQAQGVA